MLIANQGYDYNCIQFVENMTLLPTTDDTVQQCNAKIKSIARLNSTTQSIALFGGRAGVMWPTGGAYNASTAAHAVAIFMLARGEHWWFVLPDANAIDPDVTKLFLTDYGAPTHGMEEVRPGIWQRQYELGTASFNCNRKEAALTSTAAVLPVAVR